jgi:hypothetical protein
MNLQKISLPQTMLNKMSAFVTNMISLLANMAATFPSKFSEVCVLGEAFKFVYDVGFKQRNTFRIEGNAFVF